MSKGPTNSFAQAPWAVLAFALALSACGQNGGGDQPTADGPERSSAAITDQEIEAKADALLADLGAPASAEQSAALEGVFEAAGAEPDWRLTAAPEFVAFERPGLDEITGVVTRREVRAAGSFMIAEPLTIAIKQEACTYGAAAENYEFRASVLFEGVVYEGCARRGGASGSAARGWAENIHQYLSAIDLCLTRVSAKPGHVTIGYVDEDGQTVVRLLESDGGRAECTLSADGTRIAALEPLSDRSVFDGERDPLFTRAPSSPPPGYASEEVVDIDGAVIGYLSRKTR